MITICSIRNFIAFVLSLSVVEWVVRDLAKILLIRGLFLLFLIAIYERIFVVFSLVFVKCSFVSVLEKNKSIGLFDTIINSIGFVVKQT